MFLGITSCLLKIPRVATAVALKKAAQNFKITAVKTEKLVEKVQNDIMAKLKADITAGKDALEELWDGG